MVRTEPASAVVVRVPIPAAMSRTRRRWDPSAATGVPPHVTILFPFVAASDLTPAIRDELAGIAADEAPFDVVFASVRRFPDVVYAAPEPAAPFTRLTAAVAARFPDHPPYGGAFDEVVPHLTIAENDHAPLDDIAAMAAASLPFRHRVTALEVIVEGGDGRWRRRWRISLRG